MDTCGVTNRGGVDNANIAGSAPGGRQGHLPQRSASVEDEHRNAGTNGGRQVEASQVLALSSGCAVNISDNYLLKIY